jgi:glycosyltransferase involved in cell wall biosynthesis
MKSILIIPAYNEARILPTLIAEIHEKLPDFDYVIVNDGSKDGTQKLCRENGFNAIHLVANLGIGGAVQAGYKYARENDYDIAIQLDGDGQHDPASVPALIQPILDGRADFVIGSRFIEKKGFQTSFLRRFGIVWLNSVLKLLTKKTVTDATSGLRAANAEIIRLFADNYPYDYPEPETICEVVRRKFRVEEIPVVMRNRTTGKSSIRPIRSGYYLVKVTLAIIVTNIKRI